MSREAPSTEMRWQMRPAGREWDAVRMPATLGRPALAQLGDTATAYRDDDGSHVFLIPCGSNGQFGPDTEYLSNGTWLFMPGPDRTTGPGLRWLSGSDRVRTSPEALRAALDAVRQQAPETDR